MHLDLRISKKLMPNEHQMAFQIFLQKKNFMFLGGHMVQFFGALHSGNFEIAAPVQILDIFVSL